MECIIALAIIIDKKDRSKEKSREVNCRTSGLYSFICPTKKVEVERRDNSEDKIS